MRLPVFVKLRYQILDILKFSHLSKLHLLILPKTCIFNIRALTKFVCREVYKMTFPAEPNTTFSILKAFHFNLIFLNFTKPSLFYFFSINNAFASFFLICQKHYFYFSSIQPWTPPPPLLKAGGWEGREAKGEQPKLSLFPSLPGLVGLVGRNF